MKRKFCIILIGIISILCLTLGLTACGNGQEKTVAFVDKTVRYNGQEQEITVSDLPDGWSVIYENNKGTEIGEYKATATVTKKNGEILVLTATLTITKGIIAGVTFADKTVIYDGNEHTVLASGIPDDATAVYENEKGTNAGEYNATVTVSKDKYKDLVLHAKLKINKATFTGITFEDDSFIIVTGGSTKSLAITTESPLPAGTTVKYINNDKSEAGVYEVTATVSNPNYETLTLNATMTIKSVVGIARDFFEAVKQTPDLWEFVPDALHPENMAYTTAPVGRTKDKDDFATGFVNVSNIKKKFVGKQFAAMYDGIASSGKVLALVNKLMIAPTEMINIYQDFINKNPEQYKSFSGTAPVAGLKFKIDIAGDDFRLVAGNSTVSFELEYDGESKTRKGRVQITDGATLKYESSESSLKLAYNAEIKGVGVTSVIEFMRTENAVAGYFHSYAGTDDINLKSTATYASDNNYTRFMSTKRESDDLLIKAYEEVYSSRTGEYVGGRVKEYIKFNKKMVDFDTYWFNLTDIGGVTSVKAEDKANGTNPDTIYINNWDTEDITVDHIQIDFTRIGSRKYDIEMREVEYIVKTESGDDTEYETVKYEIPMIFVQTDKLNELPNFQKDNNKNPNFTVKPIVPTAIANVIDGVFDSLESLMQAVKTVMTKPEIVAYIGNKDTFLNNVS